MCTVTLVPVGESSQSFVLTSNRDEAVQRETLPPEVYSEKGVKLLYPKDAEAGGTWIGVSDRNRAICLLNGGFEKHLRNPPYRKSRGVVVRDLLTAVNLKKEIGNYDLEGIEAFTAVLVDWGEELRFLELVWDGKQKHLKELPLEPQIWSSALLYSPEEIRRRRSKFESFKANYSLNAESLLKFHASEGEQGEEGLIIDRGFLKTCSITQVTQSPRGDIKMFYRDLPSNISSENYFR